MGMGALGSLGCPTCGMSLTVLNARRVLQRGTTNSGPEDEEAVKKAIDQTQPVLWQWLQVKEDIFMQ